MNVDLFAHHYDRLNVNSVDMDDGVALDFSARKEGAIHAHVLIELDEASKRQLREVVRQWDRDDEARAHQIEAEDQWERLPIEERQVTPHPHGQYWPLIIDGREGSDHGTDDDPASYPQVDTYLH